MNKTLAKLQMLNMDFDLRIRAALLHINDVTLAQSLEHCKAQTLKDIREARSIYVDEVLRLLRITHS